MAPPDLCLSSTRPRPETRPPRSGSLSRIGCAWLRRSLVPRSRPQHRRQMSRRLQSRQRSHLRPQQHQDRGGLGGGGTSRRAVQTRLYETSTALPSNLHLYSTHYFSRHTFSLHFDAVTHQSSASFVASRNHAGGGLSKKNVNQSGFISSSGSPLRATSATCGNIRNPSDSTTM